MKLELQEYKEPPKHLDELWERVTYKWRRIPVSEVRKVILSMPERIQAVVGAKGAWTSYWR